MNPNVRPESMERITTPALAEKFIADQVAQIRAQVGDKKVLLALSGGTSIITESIFEARFKYVDELVRMGASIKVDGNTAVVDGVESLSGATVIASDLRAGAALVIAGLTAEGITTVENIEYVERGYEGFEQKLTKLGGVIKKMDSEDEKALRKFKIKAC